jgi:hypothetical protein
MDSIFLFKAVDWNDAFQRALALGHAQEQRYLNGEGQLVTWKLASIVSLDELGSDLTDGIEVYSESAELNEDSEPSGFSLSPEQSKPTQTL